MSTRITGLAAIEAAEANPAVVLCHYTTPLEEAREGITLEEARAIARDDAGLIYAEVTSAEYDEWYIRYVARDAEVQS